jgi:hypothetical protein
VLTIGGGLAIGVAAVAWMGHRPAETVGPSTLYRAQSGPSLSGFSTYEATGVELIRGTSARPLGSADTLLPGDAVQTDRMGRLILRSNRGSRLILGGASRFKLIGSQSEHRNDKRPWLELDRPRGALQIEWQEEEPLRIVFDDGTAEAKTATIRLAVNRFEVHDGEVRFRGRDGQVTVLTSGKHLILKESP